jgi:DNA replication protein DnaC
VNLAYERVVAHLDRLKLKRVAELLDPICEQATKDSLSYIDFLDRLLEAESSSRAERRLLAKTRLAHFPFQKTLADFDFSFQPSIDRKQIQELATLRFLANGENVIFLGPPGVGKTHLAVALGMEAVAHGHNVYFITVPELLDELARDVQENRLFERLTKLRVPTLLILDEMGYLPLDRVATSFLFQLVSKRYTRGSIIVTSNKSYLEWGSVFGDEVAAAAVIDRLLHHSTTVNIRGESYRLKDKKRAGVFTVPSAKLPV